MTRSESHSPPRCGNCGKRRLWNRRRTLAFERRGRATLRRSAERGVTRTGDARKKSRKERELLERLPNDCHRLAVRTGAVRDFLGKEKGGLAGPPFESARHARLCGQDVRFAPTASCAIGALVPPPSGGFCRQRETGPPPGPVSSLP